MERVKGEMVPDAGLVTQLLREQFPTLASREVRPSHASGSSNWVFRVGDECAVRLPRSDAYIADLLNEAHFLPRLGPHLTVAVPEVLFLAEPTERFSRPWTVVSWIPGEPPLAFGAPEQVRLAASLGQFVRRLHRVDTFDLEPGPERWGYRAGEPVTDVIDGWVDSAAHQLEDLFDPGQVKEAWRRVREVPATSAQPCWVHTDLSSENLLATSGGDLTGVLDFGGLGIGDRSVDLLYAWSMFDSPARQVFRQESGADQATWLRARSWAYAGPGLLTIANYRHTMPARTATLTTMIETIADEVGITLR